MRLVLSSPMSGKTDFGFRQLDDARDRLHALGYEVASPADMDRQRGWVEELFDGYTHVVTHTDRFDYETAMQACLDEIGASDGIVLLDGWDQSPGCLRELAEARRLGKRVYRLQGHSLLEMGNGQIVSHQNVPAATSVDWAGLRERLDTMIADTEASRQDPIAIVPPRAVLLREAEALICGDRNATYGPPTQDFERIAAMWTILFGREFKAHEVAMAMICLKLSRLVHSADKRDNWTDAAGYSACGYECVAGE